MAKRPILILHGWSGKAEHLDKISAILKKVGFNVVDIWLSDYLSMNDEITIMDLGQAMGKAIKENNIPEKRQSFDVIVHSTGGLVVRQYLIHYFFGEPEKCPIKHLVMLAPANFGSPLAHIGKSMVGRLRSGWKWEHFFQTGTRVLNALELASPLSWDMAKQDLFNPKNKIFYPDNLYTTVLVGSDAYSGLGRIIHENGSDGTVRVSTANLNASYIKLIFKIPKGYEVEEVKQSYESMAFGVLYGYNHGTIIRPEEDDKYFLDILVKSLTLEENEVYKEHIKYLNGITEETFKKGQVDPDKEKQKRYHQYQHLVARIHDQFGEGIKDYFLEFFQNEGDSKDTVMQKVQSEILEKVHNYSGDESYRSFLFDITDMNTEILDKGKTVDMSLCAAALSKRIYYHNPKHDYITVVSQKDKTLLKPNTTLFLDVELPRIQSRDVFKLKKA